MDDNRIEPTYDALAPLCGSHLHLLDSDEQPVLALQVIVVVREEATGRVTITLRGPATHPLGTGLCPLRTDGRDLWLRIEPVTRDSETVTYQASFDRDGAPIRSSASPATTYATS